MKFNLGEYRRMYGGPKYVKDTYQVQVDPPQVGKQKEEKPQIEVKMSGEPSLKPVIEEIVNETKKNTDGQIRHEQVDEEQSIEQAPKRKPRQRTRKSNS